MGVVQEGDLLAPYSDEVEASAWCVDSHLQVFTNIPEATAASLSESNKDILYFFAELSTAE